MPGKITETWVAYSPSGYVLRCLLISVGNGFVSIPNAEAYNLPPPIRLHEQEVYSLAFTHQLHCLVSTISLHFPVLQLTLRFYSCATLSTESCTGTMDCLTGQQIPTLTTSTLIIVLDTCASLSCAVEIRRLKAKIHCIAIQGPLAPAPFTFVRTGQSSIYGPKNEGVMTGR